MRWGEEKRAQIRQMIEARRAEGWEVPTERQTLRLTDDGLVFVGTPTTPHAYWGECTATWSPERVTAMKQLVPLQKGSKRQGTGGSLTTDGRECVPDYAPTDFTSRIKRVASLRSSCSTV